MRHVNVGIAGCGVMGAKFIAATMQSSRIKAVAVADTLKERARQVAAENGIQKVYASTEALIKDPEVDAVVLALPAGSRTGLCRFAFECGKHVLLEKPAAMNAAEIEDMIAARGDLVGACCSSRFRFRSSLACVEDTIASGALGPLRVVRCKVLAAAGEPPEKEPPPWRVNKAMNGGGVLVNWGSYDLDYLLGLTGWTLRPRVVLAHTWRIPRQFECHVAKGSDAEEHVAAMISCEDNVSVMYERGERVPAASECLWQITGTNGTLQLQMMAGIGKKIVLNNTSTEKGVFSEVIWEGDETNKDINLWPIEDFAGAILDRREPRTNLEQALMIQRIFDAMYASAETGRAVQVQPQKNQKTC